MNILVPERLKVGLEKKRLIFTVTTGRSGTGYLAKILSSVPDVASYHEPDPYFADVMRSTQQDVNVAYEFWIKRKLPQIVNEVAPIYIETSHLFCKGFVEPLIELGFTPDLILLTRPHRQVAISLYQLNTIPGRTATGLKYLLHPEDPGVLPLPCWQTLHEYQLCYWYCLEIERRSQKYEKMFLEKNVHVAKVSLSEISTMRGFKKLLKQLDLPKLGISNWLRYLLNRNRKINIKTDRKVRLALPENIDSLEWEVLNIVQKN